MNINKLRWALCNAIAFALLGCHSAALRAPGSAEAGMRIATPADDGELPVVFRLAATGVRDLRVSAAMLAIDGADAIVLADARSGEVRARLPAVARENGFDDEPRLGLFDECGLLDAQLFAEPATGALAAYDAAGKERWRIACAGVYFAACRVLATAAGENIVVASGRHQRDLTALDRIDGAVRWKQSIEFGFDGPLAHDSANVYAAGSQHRLLAFDPNSGALRWNAECDPAYAGNPQAIGRGPSGCTHIVSDGKSVAAIAVSGSELLVFDAASGALRWKRSINFDLGATGLGLALRDGELTLLTGMDSGAVFRFDALTGEQRWRTALGEAVVDSVDAGENLFVRSAYGTLYRIDSRDGSVQARWGFDLGRHVVLLGSSLFVEDSSGVVALAAVAAPDPLFRISGTAMIVDENGIERAAKQVRVGDSIVPVAADGSFSAELHGRGGAQVEVIGEPASSCDEPGERFASAANVGALSVVRRQHPCRGE